MGTTIGVIEGDTKSSECSSYRVLGFRGRNT